MTDDRWMLDKIFQLEREAGASEARLDGHDEAIERIEKTVTEGFAQQERKTAEQINHIRGEIKSTADTLAGMINEVKDERAAFHKALNRVGMAIIAAVIAAAAAQTALSPQLSSFATSAIQHAVSPAQ